jgi:hypothetical protein
MPSRLPVRAWLRRERGEVAVTLVWLVVALATLAAAAPLQSLTRFGPGPGLFPRVTGAALLVLVGVRVLALLRSLRDAGPGTGEPAIEDPEGGAPPSRPVLRFLLLSVAMFGYGVLLPTLGFVVATTALGWSVIVLLGRPPLRTLVETAIAVLVLRFAFSNLLAVRLPGSDIGVLKLLGL